MEVFAKITWNVLFALYFIVDQVPVLAEFCADFGHSCYLPKRCCGETCCVPGVESERRYHSFHWNLWNMWYFWFIVVFILLVCFGGCGYWRRRQLLLSRYRQQYGVECYDRVPGLPFILFPRLGPSSAPSSHNAVVQPYDYFGSADRDNNATNQSVVFAPPAYSEVIKEDSDFKPSLPSYQEVEENTPAAGVAPPPYSASIHMPATPAPNCRPVDDQATSR